MKTQTVHIRKFKGIKDFHANLEGKNVFIVGENGKGKSSFLQFIQIALGSKKIPPHTEGQGYVEFDKNGNQITVRVQVEDGKSKLVVESNGLRETRKGAISNIFGSISFDINEFVSWSETKAGQKKQVEFFLSLLKPEDREVFESIKAKIEELEQERLEVGRILKDKKGAYQEHDGVKFLTEQRPESVDIEALLSEQEEGQKHNEIHHRALDKIDHSKENINKLKSQIVELELKLAEAKKNLDDQHEQLNSAEDWIEKNPRKDLTEVNEKIRTASEINRKALLYDQAKELEQEYRSVESEYKGLDDQIKAERITIQDTIKQMDTPVDGLSFDGDALYYNGIPVHPESMSTSETIELGFRMKMAENPDLGIVCLEHAESIGNDRMDLIMDIAKKNNCQVIMEEMRRGEDKLFVEFIPEK